MDLINQMNDADVSEFARECFRQEVRKINDEIAELLYMNKYHKDDLRPEAIQRIYWKLERVIKDYE